MHTIDPDFILGIGRISEFGARKYHMRNFMMAPGMEWSRVYESMLRHLFAWWGGEENDVGPDGEYGPTDDEDTNMKWSGLPHLLHVAWNVMVLYTYSRHEVYAPGDDRPSTIEYAGGIWQEWRDEFDRIREIDADASVSPPDITDLRHRRDGETEAQHIDRLLNHIREKEGLPPFSEPAAPAFMNDPLRRGLTSEERS